MSLDRYRGHKTCSLVTVVYCRIPERDVDVGFRDARTGLFGDLCSTHFGNDNNARTLLAGADGCERGGKNRYQRGDQANKKTNCLLYTVTIYMYINIRTTTVALVRCLPLLRNINQSRLGRTLLLIDRRRSKRAYQYRRTLNV